ncbi:MAG: hypothetical protein V3V74_04640 [Nitrosomonadaceae bacterium]
MKNLNVKALDGEILFTGSKHNCNQYIRTNRVQRYKIESCMDIPEKVMLIDADEDNPNFLAKAATKEGFFNRVFTVLE